MGSFLQSYSPQGLFFSTSRLYQPCYPPANKQIVLSACTFKNDEGKTSSLHQKRLASAAFHDKVMLKEKRLVWLRKRLSGFFLLIVR